MYFVEKYCIFVELFATVNGQSLLLPLLNKAAGGMAYHHLCVSAVYIKPETGAGKKGGISCRTVAGAH